MGPGRGVVKKFECLKSDASHRLVNQWQPVSETEISTAPITAHDGLAQNLHPQTGGNQTSHPPFFSLPSNPTTPFHNRFNPFLSYNSCMGNILSIMEVNNHNTAAASMASQHQHQQPQQHEQTIDAIAAAAPSDEEDGPALANYFRELQLELTKQMHERESRLPKCYEEGTFWITPPNPFFTLWKATTSTPPVARVELETPYADSSTDADVATATATAVSVSANGVSANTTNDNSNNPAITDTINTTDNHASNHSQSIDSLNATTHRNDEKNKGSNEDTNCNDNAADLLYANMKRPRVFVWLVHLLVDTLYCPSEGCDRKRLQSHGWATAPCARRILDLHSDFYLMSYRYKCTHCKRTFFGHDQAIRDSLPTPLAEEFPAVLSHRSGISQSTLELMQSYSNSGAVGQFTRVLKEHHALRSARLKLQVLTAKKEAKNGSNSRRDSNNSNVAMAPSPCSPQSKMALTSSTALLPSTKKRRITLPAAATPSTTSSSPNGTVPVAPVPQQHRFSIPPPIAPRPPQPTPVFLPQPIFAMHPHLMALQQQQQQQQSQAPTTMQQRGGGGTAAIVPQPIQFQPIFYIQQDARSNPSSSIHVPKKPRKPRTILKKPTN
ncbi:hypothetical protein BDB00DRAFT_934449 [Zychaea mexicana]|uniref:uncharacterized protein n=1 Tax=Zychaea mexicana TaxID=64656 RepID=UPI0022FE7B0D|nr:uncharacterized protein BDB00DRAFT_934449 [Zychaea mexicana]KAI9469344.1 hypothetical protein BDB00DRAFT_934449 [Zychaea mexicana]